MRSLGKEKKTVAFKWGLCREKSGAVTYSLSMGGRGILLYKECGGGGV